MGKRLYAGPNLRDKTPEWAAWYRAHWRCAREPQYHGRGIKVCSRWASYQNFLADMGRKPSPKHSLDRINNDGNYAPDNCRWATASEQSKNRRPWMKKRKRVPKVGDMTLAVAIKRARKKLNESQEQFAKRVGVNQATISRWEDDGPAKGGMAQRVLGMILADIERVHPAP